MRFRTLSTLNGLSQNSVLAMYQDRTGFMWFGTMSGADRYDGYDILHFRGPGSSDGHSPSGPANAICEWRGRLWVGWDAGGVAWYNPTTNLFSRPGPLLPDDAVSTLFNDGDSILWVGTGRGLYALRETGDRYVLAASHPAWRGRLSGLFISALCRDTKNRLWIGSTSGLFMWAPGEDSLRHFCDTGPHGQSVSSMIIRAVLPLAPEGIWVATDRGLDRYCDETGFQHVLGGDAIMAVTRSSDGDLWLGTWNRGLIVLDPSTMTVRQRILPEPKHESGIRSGMIRSLVTDSFGGVWVGTPDAGAQRYTRERFRCEPTALPSIKTGPNAVWSILEMPGQPGDNLLLAGAQDGVYAVDRSTPPRRLWHSRFPVRTLIRESTTGSGDVWAGTLGGGVVRLRWNGKALVAAKQCLSGRAGNHECLVYALHRDSRGLLWVGTNGAGIFSLSDRPGGSPHRHELIDMGDTATWVTCLTGDPAGSIWAGTWKQGLWWRRSTERSFRKVRSARDPSRVLASVTIFTIRPDRGDPGILWLGTNGQGFWRFDSRTGAVSVFLEEDGLPDNTAYGIAQDPAGLIWVSTNRGIAVFDPIRREFIPFKGDILKLEFNLGAVCELRDGSVAFGGSGGLVTCGGVEDCRALPPSVVLSSIESGGVPRPLPVQVRSGCEVAVEHDGWPLILTFTALHFDAPERNRFAFLVEGSHAQWTTPAAVRRFEISHLPPGRHRVQVRASTPDGVWTESPFDLAVIVATPFWNTGMFRVAAAGGMFTLGLTMWLLRTRRSRQRELALQVERRLLRKKIANDFHDDFGARAARISMTAHLLSDESRSLGGSIGQQLEHLAVDAQKLSREMREMTWELDPEKSSLLDLATYLKEYSDDLFDATPIAFSLEGIDDAFKRVILPMEWRQHVGRIFKEGMTNVLKHAVGCARVSLSFTVAGPLLIVRLTDNGEGFDPENVDGGSGMKSMRERARLLGGDLKVTSSALTGTMIQLRVRIP